MRELAINEIQHVAGGSVVSDLQSLGQNGLTHPEKTLSVVVLSTGIMIGGFMSKFVAPIVAIGALVGWFVYDMQTSQAA